jgi:hypothetical protein
MNIIQFFKSHLLKFLHYFHDKHLPKIVLVVVQINLVISQNRLCEETNTPPNKIFESL